MIALINLTPDDLRKIGVGFVAMANYTFHYLIGLAVFLPRQRPTDTPKAAHQREQRGEGSCALLYRCALAPAIPFQ
jgi:hypothetical protein